MKFAVEVKDFRKQYGEFTAADGISFQVRPGEIFGLLGPNGAGKTTTLECLEGMRKADSGNLQVMGVDPGREFRKLLQVVGVQLQTGALPGNMTVAEAMRLFGNYRGVTVENGILDRLGLAEKLNCQYHALSTGQKRRLELALAVAHRPRVVFLDEPTAGLDVSTRQALHQLMRELKEAGTTIVLSTHDMAEAEQLADRVAIMLRGQIVAVGTPRELTATGQGLTKVSVRSAGESLETVSLSGITQTLRQEEYHVYLTEKPGPLVTTIINHIEAAGDELIDLRVERPSLEERFLELTRETA
ncbi:MAG: ABC transporter ATP-binding protein [Firmicutes bacterium]|nr:ABC transporter ATP-binding protein [Bacillota bacterium]